MLWVDAICINQFDIKERAHQVSIMGDIYMSAARVLTYLGDGQDELNTAAELQRINMKTFESNHGYPPVDVHANMRTIIQMSYFSRIWVIQEVLLNKRASLTLHNFTVRWMDFSAYFRRQHPDVDNDLSGSWVTYFGVEQNERSLLSLLIATKHCRCSDARDRVFGLMGLVPEGERKLLPVDYSISTQQLYVGLAIYCFTTKTARRIKSYILDLACLPKVTPYLPSWAPDWASLPDMDTSREGLCSSAVTFELDTTDVSKRSSGLDWTKLFRWNERGHARSKFTLDDMSVPQPVTEFTQENGVLRVQAVYLLTISTSDVVITKSANKLLRGLKVALAKPFGPERTHLQPTKLHLYYLPSWNRAYLLQEHGSYIYSFNSSCEMVCAPSGTSVPPSVAVDASVIYKRLQLYEVEIVESWLVDLFVYGARAGPAFAISPRGSKIQRHSSRHAPLASIACQDFVSSCDTHNEEDSHQTTWAAMDKLRQDVMKFAVENEVPWHIPPYPQSLSRPKERTNVLFSDHMNDAEFSIRIQRAQATEQRMATSPQATISHLRKVLQGHRKTCKKYSPLETALDDLSYLPLLWAPMCFEQTSPIYPLLDAFAEDEPPFKRRYKHVPLVLNHVINNAWIILQNLTIQSEFTMEQSLNILWIHVLTMEMVVRLRGVLHQRLILQAIGREMRWGRDISLI
jgi:hypothetical protein